MAASWFGIPTSESHSLIAGLSGAAIAIHNGIGGINLSEWVKVIYGLVMSLLLGFIIGWVFCKLIDVYKRQLVGKAQRCILVFMSDDGRKVNNVSLEYDLSNGQILVMEYSNMSNNDEIDLYVTLFMVRDLYVPEEWGAPQVLARLKQALF